MDTTEEIKIKLEQNKTDRQRLLDEKNRLTDKLAEAGKAKLRHGDYGVGEMPNPFNWLCVRECVYWGDGSLSTYSEQYHIEHKLGNVFAELERNSKNLERFNMTLGGTHIWTDLSRITEGRVWWKDGLSQAAGMSIPLAKVQDFHQKLGQMIATAKRKLK